MRRFLYLFFSQHKCVRKYLGGRWVKSREPGAEWIQWNESILDEYLDWPLTPSKDFESEEYP